MLCLRAKAGRPAFGGGRLCFCYKLGCLSPAQKGALLSMEPLYRTTTSYTFEEYQRYNKVVQNKLMKRPLLIGVFMLACLVLAICIDDTSAKTGIIIGLLLLPVILPLFSSHMVKRSYKTNSLLQDITSEFLFFEEYMEQHSSVGVSKVPYDKLYTVLETPTNFYMMVAKNQGYVIIKENCDPALVRFIQGLKASPKTTK